MNSTRSGPAAWVLVPFLALSACQTTPPAPAAVASAAKKAITPETARAMANNCFTCHGPDGRSPGAIPTLANLSAAEIAARLKRFKSGESFSTVMERQASGYSDVEIDALADYIGGLHR